MHVLSDQIPPKMSDIDILLTIKGLGREMGHGVKQAEPITPQILVEFGKHLDASDPDDLTYWALLLTTWFLMARSSNMVPTTADKFDPKKQFTRAHFDFGDGFVIATILWSKVIQFNQKVLTVPLMQIPGSYLCPVTALINMYNATPLPDDAPCFTLKSGAPVVYHKFNSKIKQLATKAGYDGTIFSTHSLRRGATTHAFQAGVPMDLIRIQGDWSENSMCMLRYLQYPIETRAVVGTKMGNLILQSGL